MKVKDRYTSWKDFKLEYFLLDLANQSWDEVFDCTKDVNQQAEAFCKIFVSTLNRHAPLRRTKIRPNFQKGLRVKTKSLIKERERLRRKASKCLDPVEKK